MDEQNRFRNVSKRLASSFEPKDLRLGGTRPKRFLPNLNAAHRIDPVFKSVGTPTTSKGNDKPKNVRKIIESHVKAKKASRLKEINNSENSVEDAQIAQPTYTSDKDLINDLFRSSANDDNDGELQAIDSISSEIKENIHNPSIVVERLCNNQIFQEVLPQEDTKQTIFSDKATPENPEYSLIKFPDSLPNFDLRNAPAGQIGKIIVRKSGKKEFVVKNFKMKLTVLEEGSSKETVITVPGKESMSDTPAVVELGEISARLHVTPIWDDLLKKSGDNN